MYHHHQDHHNDRKASEIVDPNNQKLKRAQQYQQNEWMNQFIKPKMKNMTNYLVGKEEEHQEISGP